MSTKKRTLIILVIYPIFLALLFCFLALTANTIYTNIMYGISVTYSLIFSVFMIGMGITTRKLSCKLMPCILSILAGCASICISVYFFNIVYPDDKIFEITNGIDRKLSMFRDIGPSYFAYLTGLFLAGYLLTTLVIAIIRKIQSRKLYNRVAARNPKQTEANNPMFLKSYNKVTNRFEKYLVYRDAKGKLKTSEKIRCYDVVDLIVIDSDRKVYAMIERPKTINMQDFNELLNA